ncbi:MAG: hypothetical protein IID33_17745, partial [Planctomycetes bacterium]|nr:hypothetical protein [Planctomycetota bacterium]
MRPSPTPLAACSTVSRAVREKYLDTPIGVKPLRMFFTRDVGGSHGREGRVRKRNRIFIDDDLMARAFRRIVYKSHLQYRADAERSPPVELDNGGLPICLIDEIERTGVLFSLEKSDEVAGSVERPVVQNYSIAGQQEVANETDKEPVLVRGDLIGQNRNLENQLPRLGG